MTLRFTVIETTQTPLWDNGWFDLTRFKIEGPLDEAQGCGGILADFLRDPISQRSFCDGGEWGQAVGRHGPFLHGKLGVERLAPISGASLEEILRAEFDNPEFSEPPDVAQRAPVEAWAKGIRERGEDILIFEVQDSPELEVEWSWVWWVYREFVLVDLDRTELSVAVIGYD